jgi:thioester reductase-like protein
MGRQNGLLLTGATGFLGRYLLRELLAAGTRVGVLVRPGRTETAEERVREAWEFACETLGRRVPAPEVFAGDFREPKLGLSGADGDRLARDYGSVVHAAASPSPVRTADGEPHRTNIIGTRRLLELCAFRGLREVHHVSTAFVCGDRPGPIPESDPSCGPEFHTDHEQSKFDAERAVREVAGLRVTVYRPSVIVGDSLTGHTSSYRGFYQFLELMNRLAQPGGSPGRRWLPVRLPFRGDESRDLVPVDWVAAAIARLVGRPAAHGRTYHLTAARPTSLADIKTVAAEELGIDGIQLTPAIADPSHLERLFLDGLRGFWPRLGGDPAFDSGNARSALPDLPPPRVDRECLRRLVRFATEDGWGTRRRSRPRPAAKAALDCGDYIERFFPAVIGRSLLARLPVEIALGFDIRGPGGGRWLCRFGGGRVLQVVRHATERGAVEYRMAVPTFAALVAGRESPRDAVTNRRIEIAGDIEKGLKLAVLFDQFVRELPYPTAGTRELSA